MLELKDITFAHPGQHTPYRFALELNPGEIMGISGTSGSGKSTLLDLIAGFLNPASGTIMFQQQDLTPLPPERRPISILFQSDNLFDHLTVGKNLALGLPSDVSRPEAEKQIDQALHEVGLSGFAPRRASTLSGGQQQRAALARTLLRGNPIILLDEPFTALDPDTTDEMRQLLSSLTNKHQWHVVLVSHDQDDINALATRHMRVADHMLQSAS